MNFVTTAVTIFALGLAIGIVIGYVVGDYLATRYWMQWIDILNDILRYTYRQLRRCWDQR